MCGIVGFIRKDGKAKSYENELHNMMDAIAHRGPDDEGAYINKKAAMGFRRLSIIGLTNGKQPMPNEDGSLIITFNGEIYNYKVLKEELIAKGHIFSTMADTEVVLHGYEEYGKGILDRLRGMFAFAIWDTKKEEMFLARDFFGIKPLFYTNTEESFVYGSEIKGILPYHEVKKEFNKDALESYLSFQYSVLEESFYKNIYRLMPGHCMTWKDGEIKVERYWEPKFEIDETITFDEAEELVDKAMANSIDAHEVSDREVGGFLSGGVDSSYIVARSNVSRTFSVGFDYENCNEIPLAKKLSEYVGKANYDKLITTEEYFEKFPKILAHCDEPISDPSAIALYFLSEEASKQVNVILSGEGSDEMFGGYNIYRLPVDLAKIRKFPKALRKFNAEICGHLPKFRGRDLIIRAGKDVEERFIGNANIYSTKEISRILKNAKLKPTPYDIVKPYYDKVKNEDEITKMQYIDINFWLWGDILYKADTMSMAHSVEVRVPFLDKEVWKVASKVPSRHKVTQKETKAYFRASAAKYMPDVSAERKKLGFPIPVRNWLREDSHYNSIKAELTSDLSRQFFNTDELAKLIDAHYKGKADNYRKIWTVYAFLTWYRKHFEAA